jgi:TP53 regulating kinase-like protein
MKRALESTHYRFAESCFKSVIKGYGSVWGAGRLKSVLVKIKEIERRGRYVAERKQEESSA